MTIRILARGLAILLVSVIALVAIGHWRGWWTGRASAGGTGTTAAATTSADDDEPPAGAADGPVCHVTVTPVRFAALTGTLTVYGTVNATAAGASSLALPVDVIIDSWTVSVGSQVAEGAPLGQAHLTLAAENARAQALQEQAAAETALHLANQRLALHLSTMMEYQQARQALEAAHLKAALWKDHLTGRDFPLVAPAAGVIDKLAVAPGQTASAATELVSIIGPRSEVRFGIEPDQAGAVHPGDAITISDPRQPGTPPLTTAITFIGTAVDPDSRLLPVVVVLTQAHFLRGELLRGDIPTASPPAFLIPRAGLVSEEDGTPVLYIVHAGRASRHPATIVARSGETVALAAPGIASGEPVIVSGAADVQDGMTVQVDATP